MPHSSKQLDFIVSSMKGKPSGNVQNTVVFSDDIKEVKSLYFWVHGKLTQDELYDGEATRENRSIILNFSLYRF